MVDRGTLLTELQMLVNRRYKLLEMIRERMAAKNEVYHGSTTCIDWSNGTTNEKLVVLIKQQQENNAMLRMMLTNLQAEDRQKRRYAFVTIRSKKGTDSCN